MNAPTIPHQIEHLPVDGLIPYARNSRTHSPEQVAQIAATLAGGPCGIVAAMWAHPRIARRWSRTK